MQYLPYFGHHGFSNLKKLSKIIESNLTTTLVSVLTTLKAAHLIPNTRFGSRFLKSCLILSSAIARHSYPHSEHIGWGDTVREDLSEELKWLSLICVGCY